MSLIFRKFSELQTVRQVLVWIRGNKSSCQFYNKDPENSQSCGKRRFITRFTTF